MYHCSAKKSNKKTIMFVAALVLTALVIFIIGNSVPSYGFVIQLLSVILFCLGIFFSTKYLLASYDYYLQNTNNEFLFKVVETKGKTQVTVCNIDVNKLVSVKEMSKGEKMPKNAKCYSYVLDVWPEKAVLLQFDDESDIYIRITPDEKMLYMLKELVKNKE